jgi:hypothetical protein
MLNKLAETKVINVSTSWRQGGKVDVPLARNAAHNRIYRAIITRQAKCAIPVVM